MSHAISIVETLTNLGVNCDCAELSDEVIDCDEWKKLLPAIRARMLCLINRTGTTSTFEGLETQDPDKAIKTLTQLVDFITKTCKETNSGLVHVRVTTESCGDPCYRWNP